MIECGCLLAAVRGGSVGLLELLLRGGADPRGAPDDEALVEAAALGRAYMVELLLRHDAARDYDPERCDAPPAALRPVSWCWCWAGLS